jgi:hypothetical protein
MEDREFGFPQAMFIVYAAVCQQGTWLGYWLHDLIIKQMKREIHIISVYILSPVCVTIDKVLIWILDLLTTLIHNS